MINVDFLCNNFLLNLYFFKGPINITVKSFSIRVLNFKLTCS